MSITINEPGQIIVPEDIRTRLGWKPGTKFVFDSDENGDLVLRPARVREPFDEGPFQQVAGILPPWPGGTDAFMEFIRGPYEDLLLFPGEVPPTAE